MKWTIVYYDGSANQFLITADSLEYIPVTPKQSSSGVYSGGLPSKKAMTSAQIDDLVAHAEQLAADTSQHIGQRQMGSGLLKIIRGEETEVFILAMRAGGKKEWEEMLRGVL